MTSRVPVLVGIGTCTPAPDDSAEAAELMARAALDAGVDAAGADAAHELLAAVERISATKGTWSYTDPARIVADRIGAPRATTALYELGIPQQTVIDETVAALVEGELEVALVVGGEAKARDARLRARSTQADASGIASMVRGDDDRNESDQGGIEPDLHRAPDDSLVDPAEIEAGLWAPVDQYALIENALGAAEGRTPSELRHEIAVLYERCNAVARGNPEAAFPEPMTVADLEAPSPSNRPLSFPYTKWHVTQWTVDQAAALLLTTVEVAEGLGIARDRLVFPLVGLSSSHTLPLTQRRDVHRWPAMQVLGDAAAAHLGAPVGDVDHLDLYSCFPVAVRIQQRELGIDADRVPTVTGGMSFAGGPFNNYVFQSTAAMGRRLRDDGGRGLVTSVSGLLTKPGLGIWSVDPPTDAPLLADLAGDVRRATPTVPVRQGATGDAVVATWTVTHQGQDPAELIVLADHDDGSRSIARSDDTQLMARAMAEGLVGTAVTVDGGRLRSRHG